MSPRITDMSTIENYMMDCTLCPRKCHANRLVGQTGYCGQTAIVHAARAALHFWEEPVISGKNGSGTIFFSGCSLRCVFCQNHEIAIGENGYPVTGEHLTELFFRLREKGAHNINLVTPSHFVPQVALAIRSAKDAGFSLPIVYNTGSYEEPDTLKMLEGLVDIYLPDFKYFDPAISARYANAPDYFTKASAAIAEMFRQVGEPVLTSYPSQNTVEGTDSATAQSSCLLMKRGVIVRHLLLPGQTKDSKKILRHLHNTYGDRIYISILNQYTPLPHVCDFPEIHRKVSAEEYDRVVSFAEKIGIVNGFIQEGDVAQESFIPAFNGEGILS